MSSEQDHIAPIQLSFCIGFRPNRLDGGVSREVMNVHSLKIEFDKESSFSQEYFTDRASRCTDLRNLKDQAVWLNGPHWLVHDSLALLKVQHETDSTSDLINVAKLNAFQRARRVVAPVNRFKVQLRQ